MARNRFNLKLPYGKIIHMLQCKMLKRHQLDRYPFLERPCRIEQPRRTREFKFERLRHSKESPAAVEYTSTPVQCILDAGTPERFNSELTSASKSRSYLDVEPWSDDQYIDYFNKSWRDLHRDDDDPVSLLSYSGLGDL